jgi:hypothetical protein
MTYHHLDRYSKHNKKHKQIQLRKRKKAATEWANREPTNQYCNTSQGQTPNRVARSL